MHEGEGGVGIPGWYPCTQKGDFIPDISTILLPTTPTRAEKGDSCPGKVFQLLCKNRMQLTLSNSVFLNGSLLLFSFRSNLKSILALIFEIFNILYLYQRRQH